MKLKVFCKMLLIFLIISIFSLGHVLNASSVQPAPSNTLNGQSHGNLPQAHKFNAVNSSVSSNSPHPRSHVNGTNHAPSGEISASEQLLNKAILYLFLYMAILTTVIVLAFLTVRCIYKWDEEGFKVCCTGGKSETRLRSVNESDVKDTQCSGAKLQYFGRKSTESNEAWIEETKIEDIDEIIEVTDDVVDRVVDEVELDGVVINNEPRQRRESVPWGHPSITIFEGRTTRSAPTLWG